MKNVDQLLSSLREHGTVDSEGSFTIGLTEARAKLRDYQSSERGRYILHLVSGGMAAEADYVRVERDGQKIRIAFSGAYVKEEALAQAFGGTLTTSDTGADDLALGIRGALTEGAEAVGLLVEHPEKPGFWWRIDSAGEEREACPSSEASSVSLELKFSPSWKERLSGFLAGLRGYSGSNPEERLVQEFCDHSLVPVEVRGQRVDRPLFLPESAVAIRIGSGVDTQSAPDLALECGDVRGAICLAPGKVQLIIRGVAYCEMEGTGYSGFLHCSGLQRDATREKVVKNAAYHSLQQRLAEVKDDALEALALKLPDPKFELVDPYLHQLSALLLQEELSPEASGKLRNWMEEKLSTEELETVPQHAAGIFRLYQMVRMEFFGKVPVHVEILRRCATALRTGHAKTETRLRKTLEALRLSEPEQALLHGYLLLGLGAYYSTIGRQKESETAWFNALKTVWEDPSPAAQELSHTHLKYPADHICGEVASVLTMYSNEWSA